MSDTWPTRHWPARFAAVGDLFVPLVAGASPRGSLLELLELADRQARDEGSTDLP